VGLIDVVVPARLGPHLDRPWIVAGDLGVLALITARERTSDGLAVSTHPAADDHQPP